MSRDQEVSQPRSRYWWLIAVLWAAFMVTTGFSADSVRYANSLSDVMIGVGICGGMAIVSIVSLAISLHGWRHLLALPLYFFFAVELLVLLSLFIER